MTTFITFTPPANDTFRFNASVGGRLLFCTVRYNFYANRYYLQATDNGNATAFYVPMIASPDSYDINLALPFSPGKIVYRASSNQFEVSG